MLVGSIGLILAVPITTALAAAVLTGREEIHAGHDHGHGPVPAPAAPEEPRDGWDAFGPKADPL